MKLNGYKTVTFLEAFIKGINPANKASDKRKLFV